MIRTGAKHRRYRMCGVVLGLIALVASAGLDGRQGAGATETLASQMGMLQVTVDVELSCPSCAQGLERRLGRLDDVGRVDVDAAGGQIVVTPRPGRAVDVREVHDVIRNAGFLPTGVGLVVRGRVTRFDGRLALALSDDVRLPLAWNELTARLGSDAMGRVVTATGHLLLAASVSSPRLVALDDFEVGEPGASRRQP